jgi:hypothetical protein
MLYRYIYISFYFFCRIFPSIHPSISAFLPSLSSLLCWSFIFLLGSLLQSIVQLIAPVSCSMSEMVAAARIFNSFWLPLPAHVEQEGPLAAVLQRAAAVEVDAPKLNRPSTITPYHTIRPCAVPGLRSGLPEPFNQLILAHSLRKHHASRKLSIGANLAAILYRIDPIART